MSEQQTTPVNQYLRPIFDHKRVVVGVWALVVALGVAAGYAAPVSYASTAAILVYPSSGDPTKALETDDADIDMPTELRIATSKAVINLAQQGLIQEGITTDPQVLADSITARSTKDSTVLDLTFVADSPELAATGANAFAQAYLDFRSQLASNNKLSAEAAINARIVLLQERLSAVQEQLNGAVGSARVVLGSEKATIDADLEAQQIALGALSTPTIDATVIIDDAVPPTAPEGLGVIQIIVGAVAAGLVSGVIAAFLVAAYRSGGATAAQSTPSNEPASAVEYSQRVASVDAAGSDEVIVATDYRELAELLSGDEPKATAGTDTGPETDTDNDTDPEVGSEHSERSEQSEPSRPEPLQDRRTAEAPRRYDDPETNKPDPAGPAIIVSGDMEPVIQYLQGMGKTGPVTTMLTGERDAESATSVTLSLGQALQSLGARVLVVDAAVTEPTLESMLDLEPAPGLIEVTNGTVTLETAVRPHGHSQGLDVLTVGSVDELSSALDAPSISASALDRLLNEARLRYHTILITGGCLTDSPAIDELAPVTDGLIIGTDRLAGDQATPLLHDLLAELPVPTLELLSAPSIGGAAMKLSDSAVGM